MKFSIIISITLIYIIFASSTCQKSGFGCTETTYNFEAIAKVVNPKDSINIGDTIWLEISASVLQTDLLSGNPITFKNAANLGTAIGFGELVNPNSPVFAENDFFYVLQKGENVNNNRAGIKEYKFTENGNMYEFRLGIIPKKKGYFNFGLSDASNVFRYDDKCTKAFYRIYFKETPLHLYLITRVFGTVPDSSFSSPYCFKVK
jgi:hypothetical protein